MIFTNLQRGKRALFHSTIKYGCYHNVVMSCHALVLCCYFYIQLNQTISCQYKLSKKLVQQSREVQPVLLFQNQNKTYVPCVLSQNKIYVLVRVRVVIYFIRTLTRTCILFCDKTWVQMFYILSNQQTKRKMCISTIQLRPLNDKDQSANRQTTRLP